ncbi:MAG TPA: ATP-binding protein, partial [Acidimicrobiales bacterium]|nr:ATP-binding protein [Acidimicrobiales bacterium]
PLTVLRLDAEGLDSAEDRVRIAGDVDRLEQVITRVIRESRYGSRHQGASARHGTCDLGLVVRHRLAFWSILATGQGRQMTIDIDRDPRPIGVSQGGLEVCLDALINNVLAHTPVGVPFSVTVMSGSSDSSILVVEDAGGGLAGNTIPTRGDSGGSGTGLGLDIVRQTAEASGGRLTAGRSREGGARFEVHFGSADGL